MKKHVIFLDVMLKDNDEDQKYWLIYTFYFITYTINENPKLYY